MGLQILIPGTSDPHTGNARLRTAETLPDWIGRGYGGDDCYSRASCSSRHPRLPGVIAGRHACAVSLIGYRADAATAATAAELASVGGSLDDCGELRPHLCCDRGELVVADDREHPLGVDRGDVRLAVRARRRRRCRAAACRARVRRRAPGGRAAGCRRRGSCRARCSTPSFSRSVACTSISQRTPKPSCLQFGADALDRVGERERGRGAQRVAGCGGHSHSSSR